MADSPCLSVSTCLAQRRRVLSLPENDPRHWNLPCTNCIEGCARQMDGFKPEPDIPPTRRSQIEPWHHNPKRTQISDRASCACGVILSTTARYYGHGMCMGCYRKSIRPPEKCVVAGCINKSRRRGLCKRHIRELKETGAAT